MDIVLNDFISVQHGYPLNRSFEWASDLVSYDSGLEQRRSIYTTPRRIWEAQWPLIRSTVKNELLEIFMRGRGAVNWFKYLDVDDCDCIFNHTQAKHDIVIATIGGAGAGLFEIAGDQRVDFLEGTTFAIAGSTGNNGSYTCSIDSTYDGTNTLIIPDEAVLSGVDDGYVLHKEFQLQKTYYSGETEEWNEHCHYLVANCISVTVAGVARIEGIHYTVDDDTGMLKFLSTYTPANTNVIIATFRFYFKVRFDVGVFEIQNISPKYYTTPGLCWVQIKE